MKDTLLALALALVAIGVGCSSSSAGGGAGNRSNAGSGGNSSTGSSSGANGSNAGSSGSGSSGGAPGSSGASGSSGSPVPEGGAFDGGSYAPGASTARWGMSCATQGAYGDGDGSLLICDGGAWRYALRSDVPDGTYGGFTTRPDWYPPLRTIFNLPADSCKLALAQAPIDPADVTTIVPYGAMIGGHVTPIDHMYVNVSTLALDAAARANAAYVQVRAPADGIIIEASSLGSPTSMRVVIAHACETVTTFMVLNQLAGVLAPYQASVSAGAHLAPNLPIKAGDVFAMQRDNPMDFSLEDGATWLSGYAHPFPYVSQDPWKPYTADPLPYFPPAIASQYGAKMQRTDSPRSGRIDWDKAGAAAGNWYLDGTIGYRGMAVDAFKNATGPVPGGQVPGKNVYSWSHLSLAPHWVQPSVWIASIGTWKDPAGDFVQLAIRTDAASGPPMPDAVTTSSGTVVYELASWSFSDVDGGPVDPNKVPVGYQVTVSPQTVGVLAVRVNSNNTITVEKRPDLTSAAAFPGFSSRAETYWR